MKAQADTLARSAVVSGRPDDGQRRDAVPVDAFLQVRGIVKRYRSGHVANRGVDLTASLGEVVALLGPNGAGKTTLVLQLLGLMAPTEGEIRIANIDVVANPNGVKHLIGYQPQGHMAMGGLGARHALEFTARLRGLSRTAARAQAQQLAVEFELSEVLSKPLNQLSGGWRRLVDVAVAFAGAPRLVVLDEPTESLDPAHRLLIWRKLDRLRETRQATCVVVTHNLLEAERVVDRVVIMGNGEVLASGSPGALKQHLGRDLILELRLCPDAPPPTAIAELGLVRRSSAVQMDILLAPERVPAALELLLAPDARRWLEEFHLAPPSLETVYFDLGTGDDNALITA